MHALEFARLDTSRFSCLTSRECQEGLQSFQPSLVQSFSDVRKIGDRLQWNEQNSQVILTAHDFME